MTFADKWMPLFGDDFWESERVAAMDDSAALLYQWLLWRQWKHGPLPPPATLRLLPHRWAKRWERLWPQVASCFDVLEDGRLSNARCADEREKADAFSKKRSNAGSKGGRPRRESTPESSAKAEEKLSFSKTKAEPKPRQDSTGQDQTGQNRTKEPEGAPSRAGSDPPPVVEVETWPKAFHDFPTLHRPECHAAYRRWADYRRASKLKAWTLVSLRASLSKFEPHGPGAFCAAVDDSISNAWQGLFPPRNGGTASVSEGSSMRAKLAAQRAHVENPEPVEVPHADVR